MHQQADASSVQYEIDRLREEEGGLVALLTSIPDALTVLRGKIRAAEERLTAWRGTDSTDAAF